MCVCVYICVCMYVCVRGCLNRESFAVLIQVVYLALQDKREGVEGRIRFILLLVMVS